MFEGKYTHLTISLCGLDREERERVSEREMIIMVEGENYQRVHMRAKKIDKSLTNIIRWERVHGFILSGLIISFNELFPLRDNPSLGFFIKRVDGMNMPEISSPITLIGMIAE